MGFAGAARAAGIPCLSRDTMHQRAQAWVDQRVRYNEHGTHEGYREDCSGFVSFIWDLSNSGGGLRTDGLHEVSTSIDASALQTGDIMLCSKKDPPYDGHVA